MSDVKTAIFYTIWTSRDALFKYMYYTSLFSSPDL